MKSFKGHILDKDNTNLENTVEIEESKINSKPNDPPAIMVMRRKSIRQFPNGQRVALYFIDKIGKYVTVPYDDMQLSLSVKEFVEPEIDVLADLLVSVNNQETKRIVFEDGSSTKIDSSTAENVLNMYSSLNEENQEKVSTMIQISKVNFMKVLEFANKHNNIRGNHGQ